jgi:DNA-binding MarR family transcriptional regulator
MSDESRFSPTIALLTLSRAAEIEVAGLLEPHGLTVRKYAILSAIAATPGVTISDLARRSGTTADGARVAVKALVDSGLVRSAAGGGHAPQLTATPTAAALLERLARAISEVDARLFATDALRELASALADATETQPAPPQD